MIGSMEPDFSFSYLPGCPLSGIAQGLAKENTAAKQDDFLLANQPLKGAALRNQPDKWLYLQVRN
mgnify:CR=1 FL=1